MGWLHRGNTVQIHGAVMLNGGREVEVVGTADKHHQHALEQFAHGRTPEGVRAEVVATLVPMGQVVEVHLGGQRVGWLAPRMATSYRTVTKRLLTEARVGLCRAMIVGGWDRGWRDRGDFAIWLDLATPARVLPKV